MKEKQRQRVCVKRFRRANVSVKTALTVVILSSFCSGVRADPGVSPEIESARDTLDKWVETKRLVSKEKTEWDTGKAMLEERVELIDHEINTLREKIKEAEKSISEADKKRVDLVEENDALKESADALRSEVVKLEERVRDLLPRLPEKVRDDIAVLSRNLPEDSAETEFSLGERYQNVIGILNAINKKNREITVSPDVRELEDGSSAQVTVLYIGIGKAYYASANGKIAGVGTATDAGWEWRAANDIAPKILEAIAILENEKVAAFVQLPIEIQ